MLEEPEILEGELWMPITSGSDEMTRVDPDTWRAPLITNKEDIRFYLDELYTLRPYMYRPHAPIINPDPRTYVKIAGMCV